MKTLLVLTIVTFSAMICTGAYAAITDGMVSAWLFDDGTAKDALEKNDGIIHGATPNGGGKYGMCMSFDGKDDYVEIADDESLNLPEDLTVAAWMNITAAVNHAAICWKGEKIGWGAFFSWRICTKPNNEMTWGRCTQGTQGYFHTVEVVPGTGEWVHVALTCNAPEAPTPLRCYVNGEDVTDVSGEDGMNTAGPYKVYEDIPVEIGVGRAYGGNVGDDRFFDGLIDDVVIYDRGLTEDEINELMDTDIAGALAVNPAGKIASVWGEIKEAR